MDDKQRGVFWSIVTECLIQFFDYQRDGAVSAVLDFQRRLLAAPNETNPEIVYHSEPFTLAQNLANQPDVNFQKYREPYLALIEQITRDYEYHKDSMLYYPLTSNAQ